jgi:hypothetical protein
LGIELVDSLEGVEALIIDYEDPHRLFMSEGMSTYIDQEKGGQ